MCVCGLEHSESFGVANRLQKAVLKLFLVRVLGQQQHIETGMTGRQTIAVRSVSSDHQFEATKSTDRDAIGT